MVDQYLQHLMALIGSNRILASYEFMKSLPPNTAIPNKNNLFSELESKVNKARASTRNTNKLLKQAAYPKALENLKMAKRLVPDFPNIQNDIDFLEGTIANLQQSLIQAELAAKKGEQKKVREFLNIASKIDGKNIAISRINKNLQKNMRQRKVRNILITTLVILTPFAYLSLEQYSFMESNAHWNKANSYIAQEDYQLAKLEMEKVKTNLKNVRLLNQIDKTKTLASISNMEKSTRFQQGLLGKVLHNGQFTDQTTKKQLDQIAEFSQKAALNVEEKNWPAALEHYKNALDIALSDKNFHQAVIENIQESMLQIRDTMYSQYEEKDRTSFNAMVSQADILFQERRWLEAMDSFGHALSFAREKRLSDYDVVNRVTRAHNVAEINNYLENAQAKFAINKVLEARHIFERIIALSEKNDLIDLAAPAISREMITKIDTNIFLVQIDNLEEKAAKLLAEKKYPEALAHYQELLAELAANSAKYQLNPLSKQIIANNAIAEINKHQIVANQHSYLLSSYKNIFRKNFNLSANIELQQPEVIFLKGENNILLYKLTALGTQTPNTSTPRTRYEIDYKFDMSTGAWTLYDSPSS